MSEQTPQEIAKELTTGWTGPLGEPLYLGVLAEKIAAAIQARDEQRDKIILELRRRIHFIEHHNQHFERCESGWCNPSDRGNFNDDPAREVAEQRDRERDENRERLAWIAQNGIKNLPAWGGPGRSFEWAIDRARAETKGVTSEGKERENV